jgi:hypothetical protein
MHVKLHRSGSRTYLRLVESYREAGRVKQRVVATLGRIDEVTPDQVDALINGLLRATGRATLKPGDGEITALPALEFGPCWLLSELWQSLGLGDALRRALRSSRREFDAEALTRVLVFNRLCDPDSKLGVLRWLDGVHIPGIDAGDVTHARLLRTMDALIEARSAIEERTVDLLRPLIDQELAVVFYDLTTLRVHGEGEVAKDLRRFGKSKDVEGTARQCVLALVQTAEGIPLSWEVFPGNVAEVKTLKPMLESCLRRYPIRRVIAVADRGLLSFDNVHELEAMDLGDGRRLEYILAVPARRYREFAEVVAKIAFDPGAPSVRETMHEDRRLVVSHDPQRANEQTARRRKDIDALLAEGERLAQRLNAQDEGKPQRGRRSSDHSAYLRFTRLLIDTAMTRYVRTDERDGLFSFAENDAVIHRDEQLDGKLLLLTNVPDLAADTIVARYKGLADIERSFRVLKSEIDLTPMFHRLPDRIRAHGLICFLALLLNRVMRLRLRAHDSELSPQRALGMVRAVQWYRVRVGRTEKSGVTVIAPEQRKLFEQLQLPSPTA